MTSPRLRSLTLALCTLAVALPPASAQARGWHADQVQGSGHVKTETRALGHFSGVALALPGSMELRIGASESVTIETDDNLLPLIETVIENGTLRVRASNGRANFDTRRLKIVVQARAVDKLALDGSGSIDADPLRGARVTLDVGGSGSIRVKRIDSDALTVAVGGSGDVKVDGGAVAALSLSIAGSGDVDLGKLKSVKASVNIAGSGDAVVAVRDALSATIAGSGDVSYYGDPRISKTMLGSGSVSRAGGAQ